MGLQFEGFNVIGFFFSYAFHNFGKREGGTNEGDFFYYYLFSRKLQLVSAVALFNTNNLAFFFFFFNVVTFLNKKLPKKYILHVKKFF